MRIIITEIYNRVKELERALRLEADILLHSLCCLQTASAYMLQKTKGGIEMCKALPRVFEKWKPPSLFMFLLNGWCWMNQKGRKKHQGLMWPKHTQLRDLSSRSRLQDDWDWAISVWWEARGVAFSRSSEPFPGSFASTGCSNASLRWQRVFHQQVPKWLYSRQHWHIKTFSWYKKCPNNRHNCIQNTLNSASTGLSRGLPPFSKRGLTEKQLI